MSQMTPDQIDKAEAAGIISPKQARAMRGEMVKGPTTKSSSAKIKTPSEATIGEEEDMRFLRSFSDVFIGIGLVLLGLGLYALIGMMGGGVMAIGAAIFIYVLAEYFGRKKRAHFPTLVLALLFLFFTRMAAEPFGLGGAVVTVVAMAGFYARIRLPFCIALIAVSLVYLVLSLLGSIAPDFMAQFFGPVLAALGGMIFAGALLYDINDTQRKTRFADNAFWLHLVAAPMIIHGLAFSAVVAKVDMIMGVLPDFTVTRADATLILIIVGLVSLVGLAINRRALIVSSLFYAGAALIILTVQSGLEFQTSLIVMLVVLGAAIVVLGTAWHPLRNQLIRCLPKWRVFPPRYMPS